MADYKALVASLVAELTKTYPGLDLKNLTGKFSDFLDIPLEYKVTSKEKDGKTKVSLELTEASRQKIDTFFKDVPYDHPDPGGPLNSYGKYVSSLLNNLANNKEAAKDQKPVREQLFDHVTLPDGSKVALNKETLEKLGALTGNGKEKDKSITVNATLSDYLFQGGSEQKHNLDLMYNIAKTTAPGIIPAGQFNLFGAVTGDRHIASGGGGPEFNLFVETPANTNRPKSFGLPTTLDVLYGSLRTVTIGGKEIPALGNPDDDSKGKAEQPDLFVSKGAVDEKGNLKPGAKFFAVEQKDRDGKFDEIKYIVAPPGATAEQAAEIYSATWSDKKAAANNYFQPIREFKNASEFAQFMTLEKFAEGIDKTKPHIYRYNEVLQHVEQGQLYEHIGKEKGGVLSYGAGYSPKGDQRSQKEEVIALQRDIKELGGYLGPNGDADIDGKYGTYTREAVKVIQRKLGLKEDGIVGKDTLAGIQALKLEQTLQRANEDKQINASEKQQIKESYADLASAMKNGGKLNPALDKELQSIATSMSTIGEFKTDAALGEISSGITNLAKPKSATKSGGIN